MPIKNRIAELHAEITELAARDIHGASRDHVRHRAHLGAGRRQAAREFGWRSRWAEGTGRAGVVGVIKGGTDTAGRGSA